MKILIIDDSPVDIEIVSRLLQKRLGATVQSVHTAEDGLRRLRVEFFDVVLLDYYLPGRNGLEVLEKIRAENILVPVLLLSAIDDPKVQSTARQAGAVDFLSKAELGAPTLSRAVLAASERGRADRAIKEREQADALRRDAEQRVAELERELARPIRGGAPRAVALSMASMSEEEHARVDREVFRAYQEILQSWTEEKDTSPALRRKMSELVEKLSLLGYGGEELLLLHGRCCQLLREADPGVKRRVGCSPRILLVELSLSLLDLYRREARAQEPTQWTVSVARPCELKPEEVSPSEHEL